MKIKNDNGRFSAGEVEGGQPVAQATQASSATEGVGAEAGAAFAAFSGAVQSRRTYGYTQVVYRAPQPNRVQAQMSVKLEDVNKALSDSRIPNLGVTVNGNNISVDGLTLQYQAGENGQATITASAVGLTQAKVEAAIKKVVQLARAGQVLAHIEKNPQMMVEPQVITNPDGSLNIKFTAKVRVNPKASSQAAGVIAQHAGDLKMPERTRAAVAARRRRATVQT